MYYYFPNFQNYLRLWSCNYNSFFSRVNRFLFNVVSIYKKVIEIPNIFSYNHSIFTALCTTQPIGQFLSVMKSLRALKSRPFIFWVNFISMGRIPLEHAMMKSVFASAQLR